ncbi:MAG: hypothetical protein ACE5OZ_25065 [Candidatus Heimdallarchaeota archaeon]
MSEKATELLVTQSSGPLVDEKLDNEIDSLKISLSLLNFFTRNPNWTFKGKRQLQFLHSLCNESFFTPYPRFFGQTQVTDVLDNSSFEKLIRVGRIAPFTEFFTLLRGETSFLEALQIYQKLLKRLAITCCRFAHQKPLDAQITDLGVLSALRRIHAFNENSIQVITFDPLLMNWGTEQNYSLAALELKKESELHLMSVSNTSQFSSLASLIEGFSFQKNMHVILEFIRLPPFNRAVDDLVFNQLLIRLMPSTGWQKILCNQEIVGIRGKYEDADRILRLMKPEIDIIAYNNDKILLIETKRRSWIKSGKEREKIPLFLKKVAILRSILPFKEVRGIYLTTGYLPIEYKQKFELEWFRVLDAPSLYQNLDLFYP